MSTKELDEQYDNDSAWQGHLWRATKQMPWMNAPLRNLSTAKVFLLSYILSLQKNMLIEEELDYKALQISFAHQKCLRCPDDV